MYLNIITGGIGSGKSTHLYSLIRENLKNNPSSNAILIVPEQFSYTTEKTVSERAAALGLDKFDTLNQLEIITFSRLARRYVSGKNDILPSGKLMLSAKTASEMSEDNMFFPVSRMDGFINSCCELFSELRQYGVSPAELDCAANGNTRTDKKIASVREIYEKYISFFENGLTDSDNTLSVFADKIISNGLFENTFFFIDDFSVFVQGHFEVIKALMHTSRGVHISLGADEDVAEELFAPTIKTKKRLIAAALSDGVQLAAKELASSPEYIKSPEIRHLLINWESKKMYNEKCRAISLFKARDRYSETEHIASEIITLVRDRGFRFRDIGIICGNTDKYLHIIRTVFNDYNIPYFTDEKLPVSQHPVAKTVLCLFDILKENWSYRSVFDYLRMGYVYEEFEDGVRPISPDDTDILENYVSAHGIHGKKAWFTEWKNKNETVFDDVIENYGHDDTDLEYLNKLREKIIAPFARFLENKGRTAAALASAVFDFLCDINMYRGILSECEFLSESGLINEAELTKQVWNSVMETLDQAVITLGKGSISRENFSAYFKYGLSACELSIIPSGLDRVSVGTVSRNSPVRVKALFIIGANHGAIPQITERSGILSDYDRAAVNAALSAYDKELAPDGTERAAMEELKLYRAVSTATEILSVSLPVSDSDGAALAQSRFVDDLVKMFPDMHTDDNIITPPSPAELLSSKKRGFNYLLAHFSEYNREKPSALWNGVYKYYESMPEYRDKLQILHTAAKYKRVQPKLSRMRAEALYGKNKKYSITQLEKFTSCPFSYYMECGLRAMPPKEKKVEKSHIGSLIHAAIRNFCVKIEDGAETVAEIHERWSALSPEKCNAVIDGVIDEMKNSILARATDDKAKLEYLLLRCRRTLKKSAETIRKSLASGGYTSVCHEKDFEVVIDRKNESIILRGTIDRIDVIEDFAKQRLGIRIIDYKSGHKKFSVAAIANKADMQLVLYAVAAVKLAENGGIEKVDQSLKPNVSAILYNRINDDMVHASEDNPEKAAAERDKKKKLDGVVIVDAENISDISQDNPELNEMDCGVKDNGKSEYLNISFNSKSINKYSQVTTRKDFKLLEEYAAKSAVSADKRIKSGEISIKPCKSADSSACAYCKYSEACMFDAEYDGYRKMITANDAAMDFIRKDLEEDE